MSAPKSGPSVCVDRTRPEPPRSAGNFLSILTVTVASLAMLLLAPARSTAETPFGPGYRTCGSFHATYTIKVYASHISCHRATRIQKEYWLAPPSRTVEVNHSGRPYVLLTRYPGWKCFSGAGGGTCNKGRKVAAYTDI